MLCFVHVNGFFFTGKHKTVNLAKETKVFGERFGESVFTGNEILICSGSSSYTMLSRTFRSTTMYI